MARLIAILVYDLDEVCQELANRTGWHKKYSRQRVRDMIQHYLPTVEKVGRSYFLTDSEVNYIADRLERKKRPRTIDN